jgi:hypothetical protein
VSLTQYVNTHNTHTIFKGEKRQTQTGNTVDPSKDQENKNKPQHANSVVLKCREYQNSPAPNSIKELVSEPYSLSLPPTYQIEKNKKKQTWARIKFYHAKAKAEQFFRPQYRTNNILVESP